MCTSAAFTDPLFSKPFLSDDNFFFREKLICNLKRDEDYNWWNKTRLQPLFKNCTFCKVLKFENDRGRIRLDCHSRSAEVLK